MKEILKHINIQNMNEMDLAIYALFVAIFKSYVIPQSMQQGLKLVLLMGVAYFLWKRVEFKKLFNKVFVLAVVIVVSSILGFMSGTIGLSSVVHGIFHAGCLYLTYTLVCYCMEQNYQNGMINALYRVTSVFCIISLISMMISGHSPNGTEITYFFGYKFMTSYYFMMWLALFRVKNHKKIESERNYKILYVALILVLFGICKWLYCSTTMLASLVFLAEFVLPKKAKRFLMNPITIIIIVIIAGLVPFVIETIMGIPFVQYFITEVLHKSATLTGRLAIFDSIGVVVSRHILLGHGYGNVAIANQVGYGNAQNGLMQFIVDYGFIGVSLFMYILYKCVKKEKLSEEIEGLYIILYALIVCSIVEISYNYIFYLVLFMIGFWKTNSKGE